MKAIGEQTPTTNARSAQEASPVVRLSRMSFALAAVLFALSVALQIFLAGLAIFSSPVYWASHTSFIHLFELLPLLMLLLSFTGKLPSQVRWQSAGLLGLIFVQYFTANVRGVAPAAAALHPVIAMLMFWLAAVVTVDAWKKPDGQGGEK